MNTKIKWQPFVSKNLKSYHFKYDSLLSVIVRAPLPRLPTLVPQPRGVRFWVGWSIYKRIEFQLFVDPSIFDIMKKNTKFIYYKTEWVKLLPCNRNFCVSMLDHTIFRVVQIRCIDLNLRHRNCNFNSLVLFPRHGSIGLPTLPPRPRHRWGARFWTGAAISIIV